MVRLIRNWLVASGLWGPLKGAAFTDVANGIAVDGAGNVYVTGRSSGAGLVLQERTGTQNREGGR